MRKPPNPSQSANRQDNIEKIRLLLCQNHLTTGQIEYLTGIKPGTLRHYLVELESKNYVAHTKLAVKGCQTVNLYGITADGRSVKPKPLAQIADAPFVIDAPQWWEIKIWRVNEKAQ